MQLLCSIRTIQARLVNLIWISKRKKSFDQHSKQKTRKENGMSRIKFKKCEKWCSLNVCEIVHRSDRMGGGSFIFTEHPAHADNNNNNHKMVEMCYVMYSSMRHKHVSTLSLFIWRFRTKYEIKKIHTQTHTTNKRTETTTTTMTAMETSEREKIKVAMPIKTAFNYDYDYKFMFCGYLWMCEHVCVWVWVCLYYHVSVSGFLHSKW